MLSSLITKHKEAYYLKEGEKKGFNQLELQISRKMVTSVAIGGKITTVSTISYVDSVSLSDRWGPERLRQESHDYLCYRFYPGEDCKITGSTYTTHTCQNMDSKSCHKCQEDCYKDNCGSDRKGMLDCLVLWGLPTPFEGCKKNCQLYIDNCKPLTNAHWEQFIKQVVAG